MLQAQIIQSDSRSGVTRKSILQECQDGERGCPCFGICIACQILARLSLCAAVRWLLTICVAIVKMEEVWYYCSRAQDRRYIFCRGAHLDGSRGSLANFYRQWRIRVVDLPSICAVFSPLYLTLQGNLTILPSFVTNPITAGLSDRPNFNCIPLDQIERVIIFNLCPFHLTLYAPHLTYYVSPPIGVLVRNFILTPLNFSTPRTITISLFKFPRYPLPPSILSKCFRLL